MRVCEGEKLWRSYNVIGDSRTCERVRVQLVAYGGEVEIASENAAGCVESRENGKEVN